MSILDPVNTTMGDLVNESLRLSNRLALGQVALAEDLNLGWGYLQMMLQEWQQQRYLVFRLANFSFVCTGAASYTVGPGGNINTGANSYRPARIKSAFLRQINVTPSPDFYMDVIEAREEYDTIVLKNLGTSISTAVFYDPVWPLGVAYPWPIPSANIYEMHLTVLQQLPFTFATQADVISLPFEYYWAIITNLAMRLRARFGIGTYPGDTLPGSAKSSKRTLRKANAAIPTLKMPAELTRGGGKYNIFSDQFS